MEKEEVRRMEGRRNGGGDMGGQGVYDIVFKRIDLGASEVIRDFKTFDPDEWSIVVGTPKWTVHPDRIVGGGPDVRTHGQIFCRTPVEGD
ncbi:MAG: hypothetical protein IJG13_23605, partial [Kiritimatiellae bacterium]|nr:hypothetical protein [Kiritimatiellia bacterium]